MARRLVIPKLILGSIFTVGVPSALVTDGLMHGLCAACPQPPDPPANSSPSVNGHGDENYRSERGERRGRGGRGGVYRFIFEAVRRDGGPIELMPLLMYKNVRQFIGASDEQSAQFETFFADMQKRLEDERQQAESDPNTDWPKLFKDRLDKENSAFQAYLSSLPPEQYERLIGVFVQHRNLRALSNRLVAIDKLGMSPEAATKLQAEINTIREETMRESNEEMRRIFTNGGPGGPDQASFQKLVRKNQTKVDSRIEKLVDKATIEKLHALRGAELPRELMESLDAPPLPPPPKP